MYNRREYESGIMREVMYEWGRISLHTHSLCDISIFVEPDKRNQGLSRQLMREILLIMTLEEALPEYVYIDTDASNGFWERVGFFRNPHVDDVTRPEYGYEMRATVLALHNFSQNI